MQLSSVSIEYFYPFFTQNYTSQPDKANLILSIGGRAFAIAKQYTSDRLVQLVLYSFGLNRFLF